MFLFFRFRVLEKFYSIVKELFQNPGSNYPNHKIQSK